VYVSGTVNGHNVIATVFWAAIQQANIVGGTSAVQNYLAAVMLNVYIALTSYPPSFVPYPIYSANPAFIPLPLTGQPNPQGSNGVHCTQAEVGSWNQ
jgi:hypothetical protein